MEYKAAERLPLDPSELKHRHDGDHTAEDELISESAARG